MMMRAFSCAAVLAALFSAGVPARAAGLKYYQDPPFKKMAPAQPGAMADLVLLAKEGDARAQYILGDLYGKGQGGLGKNRVKSRYWFESAARNGYRMAFIRLAALAKHAKDPVSAYKWYTLGKAASPWRSAEHAWCDSSRDRVAEKFGMTGGQIDAAEQAARDWRAGQDKAEAALQKQAAAARAEAAREEAATEAAQQAKGAMPQVKKRATPEQAPGKIEKTETPKPVQPPKQEKSYND